MSKWIWILIFVLLIGLVFVFLSLQFGGEGVVEGVKSLGGSIPQPPALPE